jgi:hypothetical protein
LLAWGKRKREKYEREVGAVKNETCRLLRMEPLRQKQKENGACNHGL